MAKGKVQSVKEGWRVPQSHDEAAARLAVHPHLASGYRKEAALIAAAYAPKAIQHLIEMVQSKQTSEGTKQRALELLLGYGLGRPSQHLVVDSNASLDLNSLDAINKAMAALIAQYGTDRLVSGFDGDVRTLEHQPGAA
jgi:hypothetical protein